MRGSMVVAAHGVSMSTKAALGTGKSASEFWNMFANHNGTKGMGKDKKLELFDFTKEIMKTKPKNSPVPEKWYKKGGCW